MMQQNTRKSNRFAAAFAVLIAALLMFNAGLAQVYGASKPATPKITYLKSTAINSFTVKSNKNSKVTGYQIKYSLKKSFSSSKTVTVKTTKLNKKVTGLKGGKTYYVKLRAYKVSNGKKKYSDWSSWRSAPVTKSENSVVRYTNGVTTTVYKKADSGSASIRLWYNTKVKLVSSLTSSSSGTWYKVNYRGNYYYLWDKTSKPAKLAAANAVKSDSTYLNGCTTEHQKELLKTAFNIYHNWATAYDYGSVYSPTPEKKNGKYLLHCSGFMSYVYNSTLQKYDSSFKITGRASDFVDIGNVIKGGDATARTVCSGTLMVSKLKPGDILCFKLMNTKNSIDHVAVYIGNGQIIQSTRAIDGVYTNSGLDPDGGVCIAPLTGMYKDGFKKAIRITL